MSTAILEMNNLSWYTLASMGIVRKHIKIDYNRGLVFVKCADKVADTIKSLIDSATIIKGL